MLRWWALSIFLASVGLAILTATVPSTVAGPPGSIEGVFFGAVFLLSGLAIYRAKLRRQRAVAQRGRWGKVGPCSETRSMSNASLAPLP